MASSPPPVPPSPQQPSETPAAVPSMPAPSFAAALSALTPPLPALVRAAYTRAAQSGALTFTASAATATVPITPALSFRVRFCPSLADKPRNTRAEAARVDPFAPPTPALLVAALPGYNVVLNRYPVVERHFLLCTAAFEAQTDPLRARDLDAAAAVLGAWAGAADERLFGFYNSGEPSGASQPHRHIQFIPVSARRALPFDAVPEGAAVWVNPELPFESYCVRWRETGIAEAYRLLMARVPHGGAYNLGVTDEWMAAVPRVSEDGGREGVAINGTVCAGEVLARTDEDWGFFRGGGLAEVLAGIGVRNGEIVKRL